ncbi:poly(rC)-binding protein 3-like [Aphis gossypii]|uniref:poly(rC)-binding protein 3-like n=1 Tax=Aphis gossypii TaxID=80765 RepID=UPI002159A056|nr:poly(rC)-binding protein 3-like [Aphis gossypii]
MSVKARKENELRSRPFGGGGWYGYNNRDDVELTVRILITGGEVANIIGKGGETVKNIRSLSGAKVKITNGSLPERIVLITGNRITIYKATELICHKVEEFFERLHGDWNGPKSPLTLKLIMPASKCGFIIGKSGNKIKEIRESSGATISVGLDLLPYSTERIISITGSTGTVSHCVYLVCNVILNSPCSDASIPYDPCNEISGFASCTIFKDYGRECSIPLNNLAALGLGTKSTANIKPADLAALAGSQLRKSNRQNQNVSREHNNQKTKSNTEKISMTVPNDLIGCVIGKKGSKIAEIRQISGASIYIFKSEGSNENVDRRITIAGNKESIAVAKYLIEMSVQLQKANLGEEKLSYSPDNGSSSNSSTPTVVELFAKPHPITTISSLYAYIALTSDAKQSPPIQTTGVHRPKSSLKRKRSPSRERTNAVRTKWEHY